MDTQFAKFLQIGIIVEDVDATVKHWEEYGIGPWRVGTLDTDSFPDFHMDGKPDRLIMRTAFCDVYGFEIELIQPISDSAYKRWLSEHGQGMHHIAVITKDKFGKVIDDYKKSTGKDLWIWGKEDTIGMNFAYMDLVKELGLMVEIYDEDKKGGIPADFKVK
jgi:methylmalonyl-CoA/ethylmalonyl-CoA epimerase